MRVRGHRRKVHTWSIHNFQLSPNFIGVNISREMRRTSHTINVGDMGNALNYVLEEFEMENSFGRSNL
jgi:hypothetical protein